jgi:Mg/Co/Ni transporter MgtE
VITRRGKLYFHYYREDGEPCVLQTDDKDWNSGKMPELGCTVKGFKYRPGLGFFPFPVIDIIWNGRSLAKWQFDKMIESADISYFKELCEKEDEKTAKEWLEYRRRHKSIHDFEEKLKWSKNTLEKLSTSKNKNSLDELDVEDKIAVYELLDKVEEEFWTLVREGKISVQQLAGWICDTVGGIKDKEIARILRTTELNVRQQRLKVRRKIRESMKK